MSIYGIRGLALDWIKSYLCCREQFVSFNSVNSEKCIMSCGVPQGSILGPLFFLLYINDISNISNELFMLLYADDTNVFFTGDTIQNMCSRVNDELEKIVSWLNANRLSLNVKKSHFMIFTTRHTEYNYNIILNMEKLDKVDTTKFLGIQIDSKLSWQNHILYVKGKVAKGVGILSKARKVVKKNTLLNLYYSFIYPHLSYCIEIWGNARNQYLECLFKMQKKMCSTDYQLWLESTYPTSFSPT